MVFIDGQYLREGLKKLIETDAIDYGEFARKVLYAAQYPHIFLELIRVYYYDAIIRKEDDETKHKQQYDYLRGILDNADFDIKLGRTKNLRMARIGKRALMYRLLLICYLKHI